MICKKCGTEFDEGIFCPECGAKFEGSAENNAEDDNKVINERREENVISDHSKDAELNPFPSQTNSNSTNSTTNDEKGFNKGAIVSITLIIAVVIWMGINMSSKKTTPANSDSNQENITVENKEENDISEQEIAEATDAKDSGVPTKTPVEDSKTLTKAANAEDDIKTTSNESINPQEDEKVIIESESLLDDKTYTEVYKEELRRLATETGWVYKYTMYDMNKDDIPELIISRYGLTPAFNMSYSYWYTIKDEKIKYMLHEKDYDAIKGFCFFVYTDPEDNEEFIVAVNPADSYDECTLIRANDDYMVDFQSPQKIDLVNNKHFMNGKYLKMYDVSDDYLILHPEEAVCDPYDEIYDEWLSLQ